MKTLEQVYEIVNAMDDSLFDTISRADYDRWNLDDRIARNGLRRLRYNLRKAGLTMNEWDMWCSD